MWPYVHFEKTLKTEKDEIVCLFFCTDSIRIRFSSKDIPRSHFALVHSSVCVFQLWLKVLKQACEWLWLILLRISRRCSTKCNNRVLSFSLKNHRKLSNFSLQGIDPETTKLLNWPSNPENAGSNPTEVFKKTFLVFYNFPMVYNFHTFESNYVQMIHCRMEPVVVKSGLRARAAE